MLKRSVRISIALIAFAGRSLVLVLASHASLCSLGMCLRSCRDIGRPRAEEPDSCQSHRGTLWGTGDVMQSALGALVFAKLRRLWRRLTSVEAARPEDDPTSAATDPELLRNIPPGPPELARDRTRGVDSAYAGVCVACSLRRQRSGTSTLRPES